jgi:pimeloyl-ACP methyl ester carboxylesterase
LEDVQHEGKEGNVLVAAKVTLKDANQRADYEKWFDEEHVPLLSKVPGWRRTRRFVTSTLEEGRELEIVGLHEYAPVNGLDGPEFKAAISTPWRNEVFNNLVKEKTRRVYELYYTFGPASRDLASPTQESVFPDGLTKVLPNQVNGFTAIESYITTADGLHLPYRLEGSPDVQAPLIVLINSVLVEYGIWDGFVREFLAAKENSKYRILRFNSRGRYAATGELSATVDVLAKDVISLLDALRIPQAAAVIGVSLGGATSLNVALKYPDRVKAFVACDTNAAAPPGNPKAWGERIEMAEKEGKVTESGETIVGEELAEITVRRWFVKESYEDVEKEKEIERVKKMVVTNSLEGFRKGVKALYQYNFSEEMKGGKVPGLFVVGAGDGVLPKSMKGMAESYADGKSGLAVIAKAGHLPMVEQPKDFSATISKFLGEF